MFRNEQFMGFPVNEKFEGPILSGRVMIDKTTVLT